MRIAVRGAGPALVMIHGWAMHSGVFAPLSERLEHRFTLHLVDLPGHGDSRASALPLELDAVSAAIAERVPSGALWLGWSLGNDFRQRCAD
jgi:pimeloyl-[acyl-carrier protein] methyl ester esterase